MAEFNLKIGNKYALLLSDDEQPIPQPIPKVSEKKVSEKLVNFLCFKNF